jgi:hypothetical protein
MRINHPGASPVLALICPTIATKGGQLSKVKRARDPGASADRGLTLPTAGVAQFISRCRKINLASSVDEALFAKKGSDVACSMLNLEDVVVENRNPLFPFRR